MDYQLVTVIYLIFIVLTHSLSTYDDRFDKLNPSVNMSNIESYFAICAVVKNERQEDLREWVEYHYKMGCGKFYIHDNGDIPVAPFLQDYIDQKLVVVKDRKDPAPQLSVYHRCIRNYRTLHRWIGFIDADEFIVTKDTCSIPSVLKKYEEYGGLTLNWRMFGSSGHVTRPPGGTIAHYWACHDYAHVKTIANTEYAVSHKGNPHLCHYSHGKYSVDTDFWQVSNPNNLPRPTLYEIIYLHHYHLKSKEDFDRNRKRGRASTTEPHKKNDEYFQRFDERCTRNCSILPMPTIPAKDCPSETFAHIQPPSFW